MTRHRGTALDPWIRPDCMTGALTKPHAAVLAQVRLELPALQAARSIVIGSTWPPPIGGSRPSSR